MLYTLLTSLIPALMLVVALSLDAFAASFCYGTNQIRIPFKSVIIISFICSATLATTLFLGSIIRPFVPYLLTKALCFAILFIIGIVKFFDGCIKALINKQNFSHKQVSFKLHDIRFILQIYADNTQADIDHSKELSSAEAASLAAALSFDGLAVGFGAGLSALNLIAVIFLSILLGVAAVVMGSFLGRELSKNLDLDLSWTSGLLLIFLAFMKL